MSDETPDPETHDEPDARSEPDSDAQVAVEPLSPEEASEGQNLDQTAAAAFATGFDPNAPRRTSSPPVEALTGVPDLTTGENDGVEPQPEFAGNVDKQPEEPDEQQA